MKILYQIFDLWYIKAIFGVILTIFAPVQTSMLIIFTLIILDTITGTLCGIKFKKISSKEFKKSINKVFVYSMSILTTRLVEIGAMAYVKNYPLTNILIGFLIITEAISIIENLIRLGLPLPKNFLYILLSRIKNLPVDDIFLESNQHDEFNDMKDILDNQISTINAEKIKKMLKISTEIFIDISKDVIGYFDSLKENDKDLIYYKVLSIVNVGIEKISGEISQIDNCNKTCECNFDVLSKTKLDILLLDIKNICYNEESYENKKKGIIKIITIFVYKLFMDAHTHEHSYCMNDKM